MSSEIREAFEKITGQPVATIYWDEDSKQYLPTTCFSGDGYDLHSMTKRAAYFLTLRLEDFCAGVRWQSQREEEGENEQL